jgi:hypothetical protein
MTIRTLDSLGPTDLPDGPEELPDYHPHSPPVYERRDSSISFTPKLSYHLRQINKRTQILVPFGFTHAPHYRLVARSSPSLFSKKPAMSLRRVVCGSVEANEGDEVATLDFDDTKQLPWCPRARIACGQGPERTTYNMESRNFTDWKIATAEGAFYWRLDGRPISLAFVEGETGSVFARFTYSDRGTLADNGAEVGELVLYRDAFLEKGYDVEMIASSCVIAVTHFKKMGRHYRNDPSKGIYGTYLARVQRPVDAVPGLGMVAFGVY